ncbi:amino acid adenylation domain-containing protein [Bacillus vallismortis]|uniref:amino acid adenylation domain-containing protein n=1 Tax=Bacillus vallismortis TaxID=72361 RepID=UPI0034607534
MLIGNTSGIQSEINPVLLHRYNETKTDYPKNMTINQLFEEQARMNPDHIAIVYGSQQMTYKELNEQSNQIAKILRCKGVNSSEIVGLMTDRSLEMIIGLIGILKSGGAYLPIDPESPQQRINHMLNDTNAKLLLTQEKYRDSIQNDIEIINLNDDYSEVDNTNLEKINDSNDTAYIIYTSGSTGIPKGVVISHYNAIRVVRDTNYIKINENDIVLQLSNFSFDGSIFDIFGALLNGAKLILVDKDTVVDIKKLGALIKHENISIMFITTALFNVLVDLDISCLKNIRKILFGGERVSVSHAKKALDYLGKDKIIHVYGPTESTVFTTYYFINEICNEDKTIPIGKPLSNTSVYILDKERKLLPPGEVGELCISGDGLSKGYLNNEKLTLEKFVLNPFKQGERLYLTGDLVKWLPDGNIEFVGRKDHQVKVRGFRIELGEIQNQLIQHESVKDSIVIVKEEEGQPSYLAAYITTKKEVSVDDLRLFLADKLPEYMIPAYFTKLDHFPLTANGKIDKKALPEPDIGITVAEYEAPQTETEKQLVEFWQRILKVKRIGVNDRFALLGGHSLNAMEFLSAINEKMNVNLSLKELFRLSTIKEISKYISENKGVQIEQKYFSDNTDLTNIHKPFPLTGIQLAYLVGRDATFEIGGSATNLTVEFEMDVEMDRFNLALQKLIDRHSILKTIIFENGTQRILQDDVFYSVEPVDLSEANEQQIEESILSVRNHMISKIIDPTQWPLFELKAFILPNKNKYFCLNIDPLICDDSSMKILIKEFKQFYDNPHLDLSELSYNFRDYVLASNKFKSSSLYKKDEKYWMSKLDEFPSAPALPLKCKPSEIIKPKFNKCADFLEKENWSKLKLQARNRDLTPTSVLCAAYAYVLAYWSNQSHFAVNLTVFNRLPFHEDVKKMVGDFTTLMLLDINAENAMESFWDFAAKVQDTLLEALEHRHFDGVDFIRSIGKKNQMNKQAIMPIVFTSVLSENSEDSFDQLVDFERIKFFSTRTSQVYIDNQVYELNGGLYITWDYVEQLFDAKIIESMFEQFIGILHQVISDDQVKEIEIDQTSLSLIENYNDTNKKLDICTLHEMFMKRAKLVPKNIAVIHHSEFITYKELDEKSNQIARYLVDKGVQKGEYIGILGERCIETIVNLLGVLKSGAAYIPLDPDYPEDRKEYIKEKSKCSFFLTPRIYRDECIDHYSVDKLDINITESDMAYVIFTSGSTGKPKGVQITHGAAANTIIDINEKFKVSKEDRILGISSFCFDLSVYDVFGSLSAGASLVLIDDQRDVNQLKYALENKRITVWNSVPAIMELTVELYHSIEKNKDLRMVMLSGDWIPLDLPEKIRNTFENADIVSLGGATEGSIWSIYFPIEEIKKSWKSIPYGRPLANQKIYVLNQNQQLCPAGVEGELYIGGLGVASGYINDIKKTNSSFIMHDELGYIYKTGDHGILNEDGYIDFLGRKDSQVKIRGYRVELGEIENCLITHKDVIKAVVMDFKNKQGVKNLYAFVISRNHFNSSELKLYLQNMLPDYMIPANFFRIDKIPLTVNGKVNRSILEEFLANQDINEVATAASLQAESETQEELLEIWKDVFGMKQIGIDTNFYEIGGDSLKAIAIITEIKKRMNIEVPIGEIFKNDSVIALDHYLTADRYLTHQNTIERAPKKEFYATSPMQKRMYMLSMMENDRGAYHIPMALLVKGEIDLYRLENAFKKFIDRHEILRTGFELQNNELIQKVHNRVDFKLEFEKATLTENGSIKDLTSHYCKQSIAPFDLSKPPLMRAKVINIGKNKCILVVNFHHIISDGASQGILVNEILDLYDNKNLFELNVQYKDFVEWENKYKQSKEINKQKEYWLDVYKNLPPKLELPYDYTRSIVDTTEGASMYIHLDNNLAKKVRFIAKETGTTLYMLMLSAYYILLNKYTGESDIVVGTASSGRMHKDLQDVFGVFVNTIALRNNVDNMESFKDFLEQVKENTIAAFENSEYQFDELVRSIDYERDSNRNPLFDTMFVLEDAKLFTKESENLTISPIIFDLDNAKFDLTFNVLDFEEDIILNIEYRTGLFKSNTIESISETYINILKGIAQNIDTVLNDIDIFSEKDKIALLHDSNTQLMEYPKNKPIHLLFEEQVQRTPDNVAIVFEGINLTYRELNEKSNQLAALLREKGVKPNSLVSLMVERSLDVIVGMLGILKAGGAYLPIDPVYPAERIKYILKDSQTNLLLTNPKLIEETGLADMLDIEAIDIHANSLSEYRTGNLCIENAGDDLVYVIYTSGSTGNPKGVMVEHQSLVNLCYWHNSYNTVSENDNSAVYASMSFDAFSWEIFPYIITGASIHILSDDLKLDVRKLNQYFNDHHISISFLPTQMCEQFMVLKNNSLRRLLTGGDKLNQFNHQNYQIINNYGPTENTVVTTSYIVNEHSKNIPIGKPISNNKIYILDQNNSLVPVGVPGELCVSGAGLARGYLNRPELTAEKFVPNPFLPGERMYRTGDLARLLPDGNIEFLGRIDHQVKIRGYRIELGEIENRLLKLPMVREAVVISREDKDHQAYLCAYVVLESPAAESVKEIRSQLANELPDFMIPAFFVQLDKMPLTANGKVDRKGLPDPDLDSLGDRGYEAPRNAVEETLASIWKDILGTERVGINDHFFEMGGHSLKATALVSRIHKELKAEVPLRQLFQSPTIKGIAEFISAGRESVYASIQKVEEREYYPLSSAQRRLYILDRIEGGVSYNIPLAMEIQGDLNISQLEKAFLALIERHEVLRTSFSMEDGVPVQKIAPLVDFKVGCHKTDAFGAENFLREFVRPFDLSKAPLLRVEVLNIAENKHLMVLDMHHIISDGVSMGILTRELAELYEGKDLPALKIQYKDYSAWQKQASARAEMKKQEAYWLNVFKEEVPVLNMPTDFRRPAAQSTEGGLVHFEFGRDLSLKLKEMAKEHGVTLYMLLLAGYTTLLSKYTGQEDIIVGSPIAGRPHEDLKHVMGIFLNTLAMRNRPEGKKSFSSYLREVRENALGAFENQEYPFDELVEKLDLNRDMSRSALFDTMLVLQNFDQEAFEIEGLTFTPHPMDAHVSKFDLTLTSSEEGDCITCVLNYGTKLFKKETIERMASHLIHLFNEITQQPDQLISDLTLLSKEEAHAALTGWNETNIQFPMDKTLAQLFEEQSTRTPQRVAVAAGDQKLTYLQLNERANQWAGVLRERGAKAGVTIGLIAEESVEMIIGILAVLKAGAAYLPIDPDQAVKRTNAILKDSGASLLLVKGNRKPGLSFGGDIIDLETPLFEGRDTANPPAGQSDHNAYLIYTSGSTGTPKGVFIQHRSVVNYMSWFKKEVSLQEEDKAILVSSYAFDLGYTSLYSALLSGCELHLVKKDIYSNPSKALRYLNKNGISYLKLTPSLFNVLVNDPAFLEGSGCETLRLVVLGGEKISPEDVKTFHLRCSKAMVMNHYGPTEATIGSVYHIIDFEEMSDFEQCPVIGRPISNMKAYVMDSQMKPVPDGVYGELCLSGEGVARGYLNRPELTENAFVRNPLDPKETMYRTGDLVRRLPNGNLELAGRIDNQVKIRGYRIETDEIKNHLLKHGEIQEAVVIVREDKDQHKYVCAYITSGKMWASGELRSYLKEEIPEFMIPSYFVQMERIPLTPNGKVDRKALPEPDGHAGVNYEAPRNEVEKQLVAVWEEILGFRPIGISHNFFASGGDSIKALQIISRLSREGIAVEMKDLFAYPEIKQLSRYAKTVNGQEESYEIESGNVLLTPIQKAFFSGGTEEVNHYNHAVMLYRKDGFHTEWVKEVLEEIMKHHDALRMIFPNENGKVRPFNRGVKKKQFGFYVYDVSSEEVPNQTVLELATKLQLQMDIQTGPLVNAAVFKAKDGDHLLLIIHHLVIDGLSWRILFEDLALGYSQLKKGETVSFYSKTTSYKTYASKLQAYAEGKKLAREKQYWMDVLKEKVPFLETKEEVESYWYEDSDTFRGVLDKEATRKLLRETNRAYHTDINDLLVTALLMAARQETGENRIRLSLEGHGREQIVDEVDISRTVGWFTTKYPVLIDLGEETSLSMTIKMVKETIRKIPNKGIGYGILKHLNEDSELKAAPQPPLLFNYLGQMDEDLQNAAFSSSSLPTGESIGNRHARENAMEMNAIVLDGQLVIDTTYNTKVYSKQTVKHFTEAYKEALYEVIDHCVSKEEAERTPSDYGDKALDIYELEDIKRKHEGFEIEKIYPLANMQQGMLFHSLENHSSGAYFEQIVIEANGTIDPLLLEKSFNAIMERHELLRSAIEYEITVKPRNVILKNRKIGFRYQDIRRQSAEQQKVSMERFLKEDREKGFDLSRDPLIRLQLIQTGDEEYTLIWSNHHILFDGWGRGIILAELFQFYGDERFGRTRQLEEPEAYSTYIRWLEEQSREDAAQYWKNYLKGYKEKSGIPVNRKSGKTGDSGNREKVIALSRELTGKLADLATRNHVTIHTALQSAWGVLLAKYNQTDDVVFGSVVSGRDAKVPGIENMVGLFINTIPTRIQASDHQSFREVLQRVQEGAIESQAYSYLNLSDVQSLSELKRDLIDHVMIFENYALDDKALDQGENELGFVFHELKGNEATNYGLTVVAVPGEQLILKFAYDGNVYSETIIENLGIHLTRLMEQAAEDEHKKIGDLQLLSNEEKDRILSEFNQTETDYPKDKTIQQLFMEQAYRTPEQTAVVCGHEMLTYRELNERSNQIARLLLQKGVQPETIVGIMADRSPEMIAGMIGILKSGAAYLPIDPDYPEERLKYLVKDSGTKLLLTEEHLIEKIPFTDTMGISVIALDDDRLAKAEKTNVTVRNKPSDLAYVIYTSGSTGQPKGVLVEHKSLMNLCHWYVNFHEIHESDRITNYLKYSFDASITEIFPCLITGAELHVLRGDIRLDMGKLNEYMNENGITVATLPYKVGEQFMQQDNHSLRMLISGGEQLNMKTDTEYQLVNAYGPTENTCVTTSYFADRKGQNIPIGKPIYNTEIYIVNQNNRLCPVGVVGELCVSGDGVARGYLNNPELTAEKFVSNPFASGERMYRTGDLARWLPDGNIEFVGRIDHQIKLRGYRIELGEIESHLLEHPDVKEAAVIAREGSSLSLCGYLVCEKKVTPAEVREFLEKRVPDYMIPAYFVQLDKLPLTTNDKVDRKALPAPERSALSEVEYEAPKNYIEETIVLIWEELLGVKPIGISDNFFDIGGNSLKLMSALTSINKQMNTNLSVHNVFENPTVKQLTNVILSAGTESKIDILDYVEEEV